MKPLHICISENRAQDEIGVKLLVLSFTRHEPNAILHLFVEDLSSELKVWLKQFPNVRRENLRVEPGLGWNVKARILEHLLSTGLDQVVWLDSDIIVTSPISQFFVQLPDERLVVAEEFFTIRNRGVLPRTRGWGLPTGRELPFTPNSCVLRVTGKHLPFLAAWQQLLERPDYKKAQDAKWHERPFYMMGDQDAMSALLGSQDFKALDVGVIRRGTDIAQCFGPDGYGPLDRLRNGRRLPPFIHAQGGKPWRLEAQSRAYHYVSPYWYAARPYRDDLAQNQRSWLEWRPKSAEMLDLFSFGNPNLAGILPALGHQVTKRGRRLANLIRKSA